MAIVDVCLTPAVLNTYDISKYIVVVIDIFRATSTICSAFENNAKEIIPVQSLEQAEKFRDSHADYIIAAERDGKILPFAHIGNSPSDFKKGIVDGKTMVYSTTNGTKTIQSTTGSKETIIGSFLNINAVINYLTDKKQDTLLLCSAWKNKINLEDTIYAGAITEQLLDKRFIPGDDSTYAALDLWNMAKSNPQRYLEKASHKDRMIKLGIHNSIKDCLQLNTTDIVPVFVDGVLVKG